MSKPIDTPITATPHKSATPQVPEPEMLTRNDLPATTANKRWNIVGVQPQRGEPMTEVTHREMRVPMYDTEHSRTIRAHEMVHAKVSPTAKQFDKWIARGYATAGMMVRVEELRVNILAQQAGFDTMTHLSDGSEYLAGQRTAEAGDFRSAVADAIAFRSCAGYEKYLEGVMSKKPHWVEYLNGLAETAETYFLNILKAGHKASPQLADTHTRLNLCGFGYVENVAKWLEEMVGALTDNETGEPQKQSHEKMCDEEDGDNEGKLKDGFAEANERKRKESERWHRGTIPKRSKETLWEELKVATPALERNVMGAIGRKRVATNMGRSPRRMSRLLTDPDKRIFDRTMKGAGGVVLIDTSGSMSLEHDEVMEMVLSAPSALVAQYSGGGRSGKPNLYVVANKGKCVKQLPTPNGGNGVDAPAIRWALSKRQRTSAPVIWVTDGGVTGKGDGWYDDLAMECIALIKAHGIYTAQTAEEAVAMLKAMAKGEKVRSTVPPHLAHVYEAHTGHTLTYR